MLNIFHPIPPFVVSNFGFGFWMVGKAYNFFTVYKYYDNSEVNFLPPK